MEDKMKTIYFDNMATTPVDSEVVKVVNKCFTEEFGNASSGHHKGQEARRAVELARDVIAKSISAKSDEIVFTSGGTESNNFAVKGIAFANKDRGNHIITTKVDHDCVLNSCKWLETQGFKVTFLDVDKEGFVQPDVLEKAITPQTILVSIIHGNNEIGTINDLNALGEICRKHKVYFHTDACQSYTKTEINVKKQAVDLITINAHKIHGPKGAGALYIRTGTKIIPFFSGGGQEHNFRSGTENVPGIVGFAKAVQLASNGKHVKHMTRLRDKLIDELLKIPNSKLNGPKGDKRLCNNINITFRYVEGEAVGSYLDSKGICTSTGSACSSKSLEPSHVLMAIGLKHEEAHGSLRMGVSRFSTDEEADFVVAEVKKTIEKLRKISPLSRL
jgi:cysteine desulfurase